MEKLFGFKDVMLFCIENDKLEQQHVILLAKTIDEQNIKIVLKQKNIMGYPALEELMQVPAIEFLADDFLYNIKQKLFYSENLMQEIKQNEENLGKDINLLIICNSNDSKKLGGEFRNPEICSNIDHNELHRFFIKGIDVQHEKHDTEGILTQAKGY